ncbi:MAG: hypothetical protein S4CHLAM123_02830 [Chlamydiales bacterium]|nr:hypothetical protein [Chlamydiales bacterium]
MKNQLRTIYTCIFALVCLCRSAYASPLTEDEIVYLNIDSNQTIQEVQDTLQELSDGSESSLFLEIAHNKPARCLVKLKTAHGSQGGYIGKPRDYFEEVLPSEKADIHFIVTSLANKSLIGIALIKSELEEAGNRIDHLHPLRFLMTVFTDEELKVGIRNIRSCTWVWNHFSGGLKECLSTEANIGNIQDCFVEHFAETVGVDLDYIFLAVQQRNWDVLIDALITHIPREGDQDRYDF